MSSNHWSIESGGINRREFLKTTAATGAGLILSPMAFADEKAKPIPDTLNIAMIGCGSQGRVLMQSCLKIPGIRFKAICDVWSYHQKYAKGILKKYKQPVNVYVDYREMLAAEKDLDAVIVASPDWVHAEQTIACLNAGLHVYCEKEMSNSLEQARQMVLAAQKTGKLLQIGHQRRSNPRYGLAEKMIFKEKILGRITHFNGQWNRPKRLDLGWPEKYTMTEKELNAFGFESMDQFRNWRWYRKFSGGPMADLGSHQIDIFSWFLRTHPASVMAGGGLDYYKEREWYDNVMAIYEYNTPAGPVRGFYQVLNTTSHGGFFETFMGDEGSMMISEDTRKGFVFRELTAKPRSWEDDASKVEQMDQKAIELKVGETRQADGEKAPETIKQLENAKKPVHMPHLENFFDGIRNGTPLNCPGEVGYETAVSVLRANDAVESGKKITFKPEDFLVNPPKKEKIEKVVEKPGA